MLEDVVVEQLEHVLVVTLNRPEVLNAYRHRTLRELEQLWHRIDADDGIRTVVLAGAGRSFCVGADLREDLGAQLREQPVARFDDGLEVRTPIVAAVHGHCLGGGLSMAMAADIRIAAEDATFGYPQVRHGTVGEHTSRRLPQIVGRGSAMAMLLTGEPVDAIEALRIGLVNRVVPVPELRSAAIALASAIATNPPEAVVAAKANALGRSRP